MSYPALDNDILIIRGVESTDDLVPLGEVVAQRYARAQTVIFVPDVGIPRVMKGESAEIRFLDADSRLDRAGTVLLRISDAYQQAHPQHAHVAHCFTGLFLFFVFLHEGPEVQPTVMIDLLRAGRVSDLERCAEEYISSDFAEHMLGRGIFSAGDGDSRGRPGPSADLPAASVPLADSAGDDVPESRG